MPNLEGTTFWEVIYAGNKEGGRRRKGNSERERPAPGEFFMSCAILQTSFCCLEGDTEESKYKLNQRREWGRGCEVVETLVKRGGGGGGGVAGGAENPSCIFWEELLGDLNECGW